METLTRNGKLKKYSSIVYIYIYARVVGTSGLVPYRVPVQVLSCCVVCCDVLRDTWSLTVRGYESF